MPLTVNERKASFTLSGPDVEPTGLAWQLASPAQRIGYYRVLALACRKRKIRELAAGIGVDGQRLAPVRPTSRKDGAKGPPLSPHDAASRFQRYLAKTPHAGVDRCTLYWIRGWAKVVRGHLVGWGHLPIRNVVGLTARHVREAVDEARAVWAAEHGGAASAPRRRPSAASVAAKLRRRRARPG